MWKRNQNCEERLNFYCTSPTGFRNSWNIATSCSRLRDPFAQPFKKKEMTKKETENFVARFKNRMTDICDRKRTSTEISSIINHQGSATVRSRRKIISEQIYSIVQHNAAQPRSVALHSSRSFRDTSPSRLTDIRELPTVAASRFKITDNEPPGGSTCAWIEPKTLNNALFYFTPAYACAGVYSCTVQWSLRWIM